jgi:hypothetical protein
MINRSDPRDPTHLAEWRQAYAQAERKYVQGFLGRVEVADVLKTLGYRSDALRIELLIWDKRRQDYRRNSK